MPSKPDPENGTPQSRVTSRNEVLEQSRAELADVLAEIRESRDVPVPESVRVIPSKCVSRQTTRLLNGAWANLTRECAEIAHDAAQDEGIDESVYKLVWVPGQPAHWAAK